MRHVRKWETGEFSVQRPLVFRGQPKNHERPSSFPFQGMTIAPGGRLNQARMYYRLGWTALIFWNSDCYFAEQILAFDAMMELVRSRFPETFYLQAPIKREYEDETQATS